MIARLYVRDKPHVPAGERTFVAESSGDTLRRVLNNLADHPGVRTAPDDLHITVEIHPDD